MRINNPKSLAGFTNVAVEVDDSSYKLVTLGQVNNAVNKINDKFLKLLRGQSESVRDFGYAWLGADGKIDPELLPNLAITETHVISEAKLAEIADYVNTAGESGNTVYALLDFYVRERSREVPTIEPFIGLAPEHFQKGDIIIVTPNETAATSTTVTPAIEEEDNPKTPNPRFSGTYILTYAGDPTNSEDANCFAKMAYAQDSVVTINGLAADSLGQVTVTLKDILKASNYTENPIQLSESEAGELSDIVYRLGQESAESQRFAFVESVEGVLKKVPYTRLREHIALSTALSGEIDRLSSYLNFKLGKMDATDAEISGEVGYLSAVIGNAENSAKDSSVNASLISQIKSLRDDVDTNAEILDYARHDTDALLNELNSGLSSLYCAVNNRAFTVIEHQFSWGAENATIVAPNEGDTLVYWVDPITSGMISGTTVWRYTYYPIDGAPAQDDSTNLAFNSRDYEQNNADERVLAVFDAQGNQVMADVNRDAQGAFVISVVTDNIVKTDEQTGDIYFPSIAGQTWSLLIAKRIVDIPRIPYYADPVTQPLENVTNIAYVGGVLNNARKAEGKGVYPSSGSTPVEP